MTTEIEKLNKRLQEIRAEEMRMLKKVGAQAYDSYIYVPLAEKKSRITVFKDKWRE